MNKQTFITQKHKNFISYIEQTIGKNNKFYEQISKLDYKGLIGYCQIISRYAVKKDDKLVIPDETIEEFVQKNIPELKDIKLLKRYLEMFINVL